MIRQGYAFFQPDLAERLQKEAVTAYLPAADELDLSPLLAIVD